MKSDVFGPGIGIVSNALWVKVYCDEPTVVVHPLSRPADFKVHEAAPGMAIPLDDDPRQMCLTTILPGSQRCACGRLEIIGAPHGAVSA